MRASPRTWRLCWAGEHCSPDPATRRDGEKQQACCGRCGRLLPPWSRLPARPPWKVGMSCGWAAGSWSGTRPGPTRGGIRALRDFAEPMGFEVRKAHVPSGILHLQTGVSAISDTLVLGRRDLTDQAAFEGLDHIPVAAEEPAACNVLAVGGDIVASRTYRSHRILEHLGFRVHSVELSEFLLADGGATCLALLASGTP